MSPVPNNDTRREKILETIRQMVDPVAQLQAIAGMARSMAFDQEDERLDLIAEAIDEVAKGLVLEEMKPEPPEHCADDPTEAAWQQHTGGV